MFAFTDQFNSGVKRLFLTENAIFDNFTFHRVHILADLI